MIKKDVYALVSKRIKEERKRLKLTQEEVSEKADIEYKFLSAIERNVGKPSLDTFVRIADALEVSYDSLLKDDIDNKNKEKTTYLKQIEYLVSGLNEEQQKQFISVIRDIKKLIK